MSFYQDIRSALVSQLLDSPAGQYPILHDNAELGEQSGTWLQFIFAPLTKEVFTCGTGGQDEAAGLLRILVNTPQGQGSFAGIEVADEIQSYFEAGSVIRYETADVVIKSVSLAESSFTEDGNSYVTPITIEWDSKRPRGQVVLPAVCPPCQPPQFSSALSFNGTTQYVDTPISFDSEYGVIENWVNTSTTSNDCIGGAYLPSPSRNRGYILIANITGFIQVGAGDDIIFSNTAVNDGLWHKIKVIFDHGSVDIYIDGHLDTSSSYTGSVISGLPITLGSLNTGVSTVNHLAGQIAHASINGVSIPFNNQTPYDLTYGTEEKTVVNFINDPVQTTQKVVHKEYEYGYFKAVRGDGSYIDSGYTSDQLTSIRMRFILTPTLGRGLMGVVLSNGDRMIIYRQATGELSCIIGANTGRYDIPNPVAGSEYDIELRSNGDVYSSGVYVANTGETYTPAESLVVSFIARNNNGAVSGKSDVICLQGWVNGQEIDIHDTNLHIGTISEHRLIDYP